MFLFSSNFKRNLICENYYDTRVTTKTFLSCVLIFIPIFAKYASNYVDDCKYQSQ